MGTSKTPTKESYILIKIGGSVATYKSGSHPRTRRSTLSRIARELQLALKHDPLLRPILIHGAGAYGHGPAAHFRLKEGSHIHPQGKEGARQTHRNVAKLHQDILQICEESRLPTLSLHTGSLIMQKAGTLKSLTLDPIEHALQEGYIPVLSGDMVFDTMLGMSICSGDTLMDALTHSLPISKAFFVSDVDGLFTDDPYISKKAELIELLIRAKYKTSGIVTRDSHHLDVTGGLRSKIDASMRMLASPHLREIHVLNGLKANTLRHALCDRPFPHTVIKR